MQLQVGDSAPDSMVKSQEAEDVSLNDLWQGGPTLFTMLRHFGCIFCREWVNTLEANHEELEAAGFKQIIGVGIGEPKHAERVCGRKAPHLTCLSNESTDTHLSYGLAQGKMGQLLSPQTLIAGARATLKGNFQALEATGDAKMLPGTFIVDQNGVIQYAYYSKHAGDHPPIDELRAAVQNM